MSEFYIEPFEGWRAWDVRDGFLKSMNGGTLWEPGKRLTASCDYRKCMPSPTEDCVCGIYAACLLKDLFESDDLSHLGRELLYNKGLVFGKVKLWGKVLNDGKVMRAQYAYPSELYCLNTHTLEQYGVPIRVGNLKDVITHREEVNIEHDHHHHDKWSD